MLFTDRLKELILEGSDNAQGFIWLITGFAAVIRLYLALTNFCISGDGVGYIGMARLFSEGNWGAALSLTFSPLYSYLISLTHHLISNWELAGEFVSLVFGVATIPTIYALMHETYEDHRIALCAAIIATIHPRLAAYSASVLTEAGFIFFVALTTYVFIRAIRKTSLGHMVLAGMASGVMYLYRTEGVVVVATLVLFLLIGSRMWRAWTISFSILGATVYLLSFLVFALPYVMYLHSVTHHWLVGRELIAAVYYGAADVTHDERLRSLAFTNYASVLQVMRQMPLVFAKRAIINLVASIYYMVKAAELPLAVFLALGLVWGGESGRPGWKESFLAAVVLVPTVGLAMLYTGERFLAHYVALTFGRVSLGIEAAASWLIRFNPAIGRKLAGRVLFALSIILILPRTLWPLGYDMRGYRFAGIRISKAPLNARIVASSDSRVAFYARAKHVNLPTTALSDLCGWLKERSDIRFVVLTSREEAVIGDHHELDRCLKLLERYPRYGKGFYDLFEVAKRK